MALNTIKVQLNYNCCLKKRPSSGVSAPWFPDSWGESLSEVRPQASHGAHCSWELCLRGLHPCALPPPPTSLGVETNHSFGYMTGHIPGVSGSHMQIQSCMCCVLSCVRVFAAPWTIARQPPLSMTFSRQEYWSGCHFLLQGISPAQGLNPRLLCLWHWQADSSYH